jgi:small subunit ribosomal protein S2
MDKQIEELFKLNAHLGHKSNRVHPKAKKFIYRMENGVSIIDLVKTVQLLKEAQKFVSDLKAQSKKILFVVTKKNVAFLVEKICQTNNLPYITTKWPAGLLTNFETLLKNINKLKSLQEEKETGGWNKFVKHEQVKLQKKLNRLKKFYGGIISLDRLPDALVIVDIKKEKTAVMEAIKMQIPIIAVVDTNVNPEKIQYPIPANDDSPETIEYIIKELVQSYIKNSKS